MGKGVVRPLRLLGTTQSVETPKNSSPAKMMTPATMPSANDAQLQIMRLAG